MFFGSLLMVATPYLRIQINRNRDKQGETQIGTGRHRPSLKSCLPVDRPFSAKEPYK